jgi:Protein of unknown function (DUF3421)
VMLGEEDEIVLKDALRAGTYKDDVTSYIGRAITKAGTLPGRIEVGDNQGFYYVNGIKREKTLQNVEILQDDKSYDFSWQNGQDCVSKAVVIDNKWYIGKVETGGNVYLGRVQVGRRGISYENAQGKVIMGNAYKVLTCDVKSSKLELEDCRKTQKEILEDMENLEQDIRKLRSENGILKKEVKNLQDKSKMQEEQNQILKDFNDNIKKQKEELQKKLDDC